MPKELKKAANRRKPEPPKGKIPIAYFLRLEIENVLCFKDRQVLDLSDGNGKPAQWTVILGDNGVGKTTLLRCFATTQVIEEQLNDVNISIKVIRPSSFCIRLWQELDSLVMSSAKIRACFLCGSSFDILKPISNNNGKESQPSTRHVEMSWNFKFPLTLTATCDPEDAWGNQLKNFTSYGYGAARRMGESSLGESLVSDISTSLFSENVSLINAEEWLLQTDYAIKSAAGETRDRLQHQFTQIIEVLKRILPDVEAIRITPVDEAHPRPTAEFLTPYGWVQLSGLGLGYRTMVAWMVDLAVRLFRRYPDSPDPLAEPAIVLVDEIDLHLHPKWQRTIMTFLTERFPNTQFIVTAHSPLVVQAAKDANIVLLRREGDRVVIDNNPEIIDNWRIDQVLTSVFELPTARPADLEPLLLRRRQLLSQPELSEADESELRELEAKIGALPTAETPDDIKAMNIIRRAAKLLENS